MAVKGIATACMEALGLGLQEAPAFEAQSLILGFRIG